MFKLKKAVTKVARGYQTRNPRFNFGLVRVPEGEFAVVERLGKYSQTLNSGVHILLPLVDVIVNSGPVLTQSDFSYHYTVHLEGAKWVRCSVYLNTEDPYKATYVPCPSLMRVESMTQAEISSATENTTNWSVQDTKDTAMHVINKVLNPAGIVCSETPPVMSQRLVVKTFELGITFQNIFEFLWNVYVLILFISGLGLVLLLIIRIGKVLYGTE